MIGERTTARASKGTSTVISLVASAALATTINKSMWRDEGASWYSAHLPWSGLWQQSQIVDRVCLAYYAFLHLWLEVSNTIAWARIPPLMAYGFTIYLVARLGTRLGGIWCGLAAAVLTAANPLIIEAAVEARPYELATLATVFAINSIFRWLEEGGVRWLWWFALAMLLALVLQMFSILGPLAAIGAIALCERDRFRKDWRLVAAPLGLVVVATIAFVAVVERQRAQVAWIPPMNKANLVRAVFGPASGVPFIEDFVFALVVAVLIIALGARIMNRWRQD